MGKVLNHKFSTIRPKSRTRVNAPIKLSIAYLLNSCTLAIEPKIKIQDKSLI